MSLLTKITGYVFVTYTKSHIEKMASMDERACLTTHYQVKHRILDSGMKIDKVMPAQNKGGASDLTIQFSGTKEDLSKVESKLNEIDSPAFGIESFSISYDEHYS